MLDLPSDYSCCLSKFSVGPDGKYVGPQQDEKKGLGSNKGKSNGQGPQKKKEVNEWPVIWEGTDIKGTAQLNKVVTKDYCGKPVTVSARLLSSGLIYVESDVPLNFLIYRGPLFELR